MSAKDTKGRKICFSWIGGRIEESRQAAYAREQQQQKKQRQQEDEKRSTPKMSVEERTSD